MYAVAVAYSVAADGEVRVLQVSCMYYPMESVLPYNEVNEISFPRTYGKNCVNYESFGEYSIVENGITITRIV